MIIPGLDQLILLKVSIYPRPLIGVCNELREWRVIYSLPCGVRFSAKSGKHR